MGKVEPHAADLEDRAMKMEKDGIGSDARTGHVKVIRNMAASMRAEAAMGRMPSSYSGMGMMAAADAAHMSTTVAPKIEDDPAFKALKDKLASTETQVADMKAAAARKGGAEPERKTLSPAITSLLARADLALPDGDGKMSASAVDTALTKAGLTVSQRIATKGELARAGKL